MVNFLLFCIGNEALFWIGDGADFGGVDFDLNVGFVGFEVGSV